MYVGIDDTDAKSGMCTTYLITEIIKRTRLDVIGHPYLVRLNPNIKYKTRGNGALALRLGHGKGKKFLIGMLDNEQVYAYSEGDDISDYSDVIEHTSNIVEEFSVLSDDNTNPGIVVSEHPLDSNIYRRALAEELQIGELEITLKKSNSFYKKFKKGRGIIGASAAISWDRKRVTYESLAYKYPSLDVGSKTEKMKIAMLADRYDGTFDNIDIENRYAAIFPKARTPVVYGIRGTNRDMLVSLTRDLNQKFDLFPERSIVFETNQGTDDHILFEPDALAELGSYSITGRILNTPLSIEGGHYFCKMDYKGQTIKLAAFEPTKEFRKIFKELRKDDLVTVYGSLIENTLNVEKMRVLMVSRTFSRKPPKCVVCDTRTKTKGLNDYRCPKCGAKYTIPEYNEVYRNITPGNYEVPVIARRHLSMPLKLEPHFASMERKPSSDLGNHWKALAEVN